MSTDEDVFVPTGFTHNRQRLSEHGLTQRFFAGVVSQAISAGLASDEHFAVNGSLIHSHASLKSLKKIARENSAADGTPDSTDDDTPTPGGAQRRKSRNESVDFKGECRGNATHRSTTDPQARLVRKGDNVGAFLSHSMHANHWYAVSQRRRKIVEEFFGWAKTIAGLRRTKYVKRWKIRQRAERRPLHTT